MLLSSSDDFEFVFDCHQGIKYCSLKNIFKDRADSPHNMDKNNVLKNLSIPHVLEFLSKFAEV